MCIYMIIICFCFPSYHTFLFFLDISCVSFVNLYNKQCHIKPSTIPGNTWNRKLDTSSYSTQHNEMEFW